MKAETSTASGSTDRGTSEESKGSDLSAFTKVHADTASTSEDFEQYSQPTNCNTPKEVSLWRKGALSIALYPWRNLAVWFLLSAAVSGIGYTVGNFSVTVDTDGWLSRGTLIANQNTQVRLVHRNSEAILNQGEAAWEMLLQGADENSKNQRRKRRREQALRGDPKALLLYATDLADCDKSYFTEGKFLEDEENLWAVWKTKSESDSALDQKVLRDICVAEQATQQVLFNAGLCGGCSIRCLPPVSLVSFARVMVGDKNMTLSCDDLAVSWEKAAPAATQYLIDAATDLRANVHNQGHAVDVSDPMSVVSILVGADFGEVDNSVRYTSSIFATVPSGRPFPDVLEVRNKFSRPTRSSVEVAYAMHGEEVNEYISESFLKSDLKLVVGSLVATTLAVFIHTRSLWLTFIALVQIALSFPIAFFLYSLVLQIAFFPFINFVGLFVVFAIGADDVFVAVDKWKNVRIDNPDWSTENIASVALPSAASSMLLTTTTTAIAFFGTAMCPVPALRLFALFSGIMILCNYVLCILLVFPAICIHDRWKRERQGLISPMMSPNADLTRSVMSVYSRIIHSGRMFFVLVILLAGCASCYYASKLSLPSSSELRLVRPSHEFEINHIWQTELLLSSLARDKGNRGWMIWGVTPADTGNRNNPDDISRLVLDDSFDPAPAVNQIYLRDFCKSLNNQTFAKPDMIRRKCPMAYFEQWIEEESRNKSNTTLHFCANATSLPIPESSFHNCVAEFVRIKSYRRFLLRHGKVVVVHFPYRQVGVTWLASHDMLSAALKELTDFTTTQNDMAPPGVDKVFATSLDFWWYDANEGILSTSAGIIAIALSAAFIVVLVSTRSLVITLFAVASIGFILFSTVGVLAIYGWTLGFLESICFAILLGISCDFVLHFSHAYCSLEGNVSSHERTKHALVTMGPSIIAASFTTMAASIVLLFTTLNFFNKFGTVLLWSLIMGMIGSLFVFAVLVDTFGPADPRSRICFTSKNDPVSDVPTKEVAFRTPDQSDPDENHSSNEDSSEPIFIVKEFPDYTGQEVEV